MIKITLLLGVFLLGKVSCKAFDYSASYTPIQVKTNDGVVQGFYGEKSHGNGSTLYWFRSIPFAEPPVGNLRFEAPVPKKAWSGVLDVTEKPKACIQASDPIRGDEDCLYLKIYTNKKPNKSNKLPVLVWIYGGAFFAGSADFDDYSPDYLLDQDVIVVAIHYRVGIFGFLSLGDTVAPGNNGIRDQILALKWIKNNIIHFGGDPDKVTIWGQSAGAASVAYLLQAKQAEGLFSKAILNSGSTLSAWSLATNIPAVTRTIATTLKVDTSNSSALLAGLKEIDVAQLQSTSSSVMTSELMNNNPMQGFVLTPVMEPEHDDAVITGKSHQLLQEGKFHKVPILAGYTSLEGYFDSLPPILRLWLAKYDVNSALLVPEDMNLRPITRKLVGNSIKSKYFGLVAVALASERIMRFVADTQFEKPIQEAIRLYSAYTNVYAYHFSHVGSLWGRTTRSANGVGHSEDLGYLFDLGKEGSEADYLTRLRTVKLWTNFVKEGNPTPGDDTLLQNVQWPSNSNIAIAQELQYLEINKDLSVVGLPNAGNIVYWNNLYKSYGRPPYTTY